MHFGFLLKPRTTFPLPMPEHLQCLQNFPQALQKILQALRIFPKASLIFRQSDCNDEKCSSDYPTVMLKMLNFGTKT